MNSHSQIHEPHKIKTVRLLPFPSLEERKKNLAEAKFNVFNLLPSQVTFDMCSHATNAVSQEQLSSQFLGDEAYAGARNFEHLQVAVSEVLGHSYVCPVHNVLGAIKLVLATLAAPGSVVPTNHRTWIDLFQAAGLVERDVRYHQGAVFTGDIDIVLLEESLQEGNVSIVDLQAFADGQHPFSLANLRAVRDITRRHGVRLICNGSRVVENAWYVQRHEPGWSTRSISEIVMQIAKTCDVFQMDGAQDPKCNTGGVLTTDDPDDYEKLMNEVVVYEGLHTYGGMAGRTMEMLARGLVEMCDEDEVHWVMQQTERFTQRLRDGAVPLERGCDGAYIETWRFLPHIEANAQDTFSAALYQMSGVRAIAHGRVGRDDYVPVQIPRLAMTNEQLDQVADAIISLYKQREKILPMQLHGHGEFRDQMEYHGVLPDLECHEFDTFPYEIHTIERIGNLDRRARERA
ncbi:MAG: beta-eliminating lyase-related protein, partial [Gammaproteobacteria bacterium]